MYKYMNKTDLIGFDYIVNGTRGVMNQIIKPMTKPLNELIKQKFIYTIDVKSVYGGISERVLSKILGNHPVRARPMFSPELPNGVDVEIIRGLNGVEYRCLIHYKRTPIIVDAGTKINVRGDVTSTLYLHTLNNKIHINHVHEFIHKSVLVGMKDREENFKRETYLLKEGSFGRIDQALRTFDDVFLDDYTKNLLISSVRKYINKYDWYVANNIPNHFGILLHGIPGTGKSSIAQAIANEINADLYVMTGDSLNVITKCVYDVLGRTVHMKTYYRVLLIEDIDCSKLTKVRTIKSKKNDDDDDDTGLGELLNLFDGIGAPNNIIYIFTTNHIDNIDKALIRPGRIDLTVEVKPINMETFSQFCMFHYGEKPDENIDIKEGLTFGTLQVEVMRGLTLHELIEFVKK